MISRVLETQIRNNLKKGKINILLGARQVGKTTLVKRLAQKIELKTLWLNGDEPDIRERLTNVTSTQLRSLIGKHELIIIDEAQRIENIGITLKLIIDQVADVYVLATGSSSLELANRINEPLTGRKIEYYLFPMSMAELVQYTSETDEKRLLDNRLIYGHYPEVITHPGEEMETLSMLASSYLYKDLFNWGEIKKPALLEKLLQALALQLGNEVSYHELGQTVGADNQTVERYIDLLEKTFVIYRLTTLSRNLRNELKKSRKIYFVDNGIRNAVIKNFNPPALRQDMGALWENFFISERMKVNHYARRWLNTWFWRTQSQQEIDYIEESEGKFEAYEIKWNPKKKHRFPRSFLEAYPENKTHTVTPENYPEYLL